jgi:DNA modification methylase
MPVGAQAWLWGGIGTPDNRTLYRTLLEIEDRSPWQCAEQITWKKKRGYGTTWRCLMTREECLRFVLGDARKPLIYNVQHTEEERGYAGFNPKYPARSKFKRLTCIWEHASDMGQNKPHECHKPEPLARTQILTSTNPGDTVLDLFAGSGEVSLTARKLGRRFVAYENDPAQFDALVRRLSE